jgi:hypothetical protein
MATHARIAIKYPLSIRSIYVHYDGYTEHMSDILLNNYNTLETVEELINLGDLSVLGSKISGSSLHSFENPEYDTTVAYHRDRQDELVIRTDGTSEQNLDFTIHSLLKFIDYLYIFDTSDSKWYLHTSTSLYPISFSRDSYKKSLIK